MSALELTRDPKPLRPDCVNCTTSYRGCDTNQWLRGRPCCDACDHTQTTSPAAASRSEAGEVHQREGNEVA